MGRNCIEHNFAETFECNTSCVGVYADVHWVGRNIETELKEEKADETVKTDLEGKIHDDLLERFLLLEEEMHHMRKEMELMKNDFGQQIKIATGQRGEELDKEKYKTLISEYRKFKSKDVKHIRFTSAANLSIFGMFNII